MLATPNCSYFVLLVFILLKIPSAEGARILGVCPMPMRSHFILGDLLFKELAARGHQVTMISSFPQKTPVENYSEIVTSGDDLWMNSVADQGIIDIVTLGQLPYWEQLLFASSAGSKIAEYILEAKLVQKLIEDKNEHFDLIVIEMFHSEILYGLAHRFNCPVIVLSTIGSSVWTNHFVANPAPSSYIPDFFIGSSGYMSFNERLYNTALNYFNEVYRKFYGFPKLDKTMHKFFPDAPSLNELMYNKTAIVLLNSHPTISDPKPHVPAMIEVGGFHIESPKPLPKDVKDFMDSATEGVILFNMGSVVRSVDLNIEKRNHILRAFSKLKQRIIWKWEDENLPGKPDNVKIMKWCPQNDIMAHPNLKLFITHGGILGVTESVYYGIPIIGIPIYADQRKNIAVIKKKGYGIGINYIDLTEEKLTATIEELLSNSKYRENIKKASQILHDLPIKPLDSAIFWVEHVIKYKNADHLRVAAMDLEWYQLYSVDLFVIVVLANLIMVLGFYTIFKKLCFKNNENIRKKRQ